MSYEKKKWEYLNKEDEEKYTELESEYEYGKMVYLSYHFMTKQDMENLDLEITNFILESTYDRRDEFEKKVAEPLKYNFKMKQPEIEKEREKFKNQVLEVIENVHNPNNLFVIATLIHKRKDSETVRLIGEKAQNIIRDIEALREEREPLEKEKQEIIIEKEGPYYRNRPFPEDKEARLKELEDRLFLLPPFPLFSNLMDYHEYDKLNLNIVRLMTSAILDNKKELEISIEKLRQEKPPDQIDQKK